MRTRRTIAIVASLVIAAAAVLLVLGVTQNYMGYDLLGHIGLTLPDRWLKIGLEVCGVACVVAAFAKIRRRRRIRLIATGAVLFLIGYFLL